MLDHLPQPHLYCPYERRGSSRHTSMPRLSFQRTAILAAAAALAATSATDSVRAQNNERQQTLYVSAVDASGNPVEDLSVGDVIVREDGRVREVISVTRATDAMDVALLVDTSSAAVSSIQSLRRGVVAIINAIGEPHRIALVTLAGRPTIVVDYTTNHERLIEAAEGLFAVSTNSGTRLDAIVEVAQGLQQRESTRAAIVPIVFDGAETTRFYWEDVVRAVERSGATLHAVTVGQFINTGQEPARSLAEVWEQTTRASGGQRVLIRTASALGTVLERVGHELSSQYLVTFGRPDSLIPPEELEISPNREGLTLRGTWARGSAGD